jgi:hypothetical protein
MGRTADFLFVSTLDDPFLQKNKNRMSDQILLARRHEQAHHSVLLDVLDVPFMVGKHPFL